MRLHAVTEGEIREGHQWSTCVEQWIPSMLHYMIDFLGRKQTIAMLNHTFEDGQQVS